jgi:hypothetical protein
MQIGRIVGLGVKVRESKCMERFVICTLQLVRMSSKKKTEPDEI